MKNIVFGDILGEGAFGKVHSATVSGVQINYGGTRTTSMNARNGHGHSFTKDNGITIQAAVKILHSMLSETISKAFILYSAESTVTIRHRNFANQTTPMP